MATLLQRPEKPFDDFNPIRRTVPPSRGREKHNLGLASAMIHRHQRLSTSRPHRHPRTGRGAA
jgi:hypothetical protein